MKGPIKITVILTIIFSCGLSIAEENVSQVTCVSNLKKIWQAFVMYSNDHEGRIPKNWNGDSVNPLSALHWNRILLSGKYIDSEKKVDSNYYLLDQNNPIGVFICPSQKPYTHKSRNPDANECHSISYYMNDYSGISIPDTVSPLVCGGLKLLQIQDASATYFIYCTLPAWHWNSQYPPAENRSSGILGRHSEGTNMLFFDGHIKWLHRNNIQENGDILDPQGAWAAD